MPLPHACALDLHEMSSLDLVMDLAVLEQEIVEPSACRTIHGKKSVTIIDCISGGDEFNFAFESAGRILDTSVYINYEALKRCSVLCSRRGASYYNCRPGSEAYP
ncbi:Rapid alkalinization factor [Platanthera zijinensis]|uniref:Rapid alkalinization factor n=1 Tax=Platanthera zijinensis TaxID=2320716 RepID=A0AAP0FU21_9ASPA